MASESDDFVAHAKSFAGRNGPMYQGPNPVEKFESATSGKPVRYGGPAEEHDSISPKAKKGKK